MWEILKLLNIDMTQFIFYIIMFICLWLLLREIKCWYWKINERLEEQKKQTELLEDILFQLSQINIKVDPDIEIVYEEESEDEESTPE